MLPSVYWGQFYLIMGIDKNLVEYAEDYPCKNKKRETDIADSMRYHIEAQLNQAHKERSKKDMNCLAIYEVYIVDYDEKKKAYVMWKRDVTADSTEQAVARAVAQFVTEGHVIINQRIYTLFKLYL
jgi:hypothetical protein